MSTQLNLQSRRLAWYKLNYLRFLGLLSEQLEGAEISPIATVVFDINGEELFYRIPFVGQNGAAGYADISANSALGEPLLAVSQEAAWNEDEILKGAITAARERFDVDIAQVDVRFVAYSYPKLAVQFLVEDREVLMLELFSWEPVPTLMERRVEEPPSNFERWSFLDQLPTQRREENIRRFQEPIDRLSEQLTREPTRLDLSRISTSDWIPIIDPEIIIVPLVETKEIHFSSRSADHSTCFELRPQITSVWCVAASVQMILDFYRYEYSQTRLAQELGLGTVTNPNGLPYSKDGKVVTILEHLSSNALDATMNKTPIWSEFRNEIRANRPLISFIPGHSRAVAGFTESRIAPVGETPFKGLLVYDPWPPNVGVITRWENFNVSTYRRTFTAKVKLA